MSGIRNARVVVVADAASGRTLVDQLKRMDISQVRLVASTAQARSLCEAGEADACLVAVRNTAVEDAKARSVEEAAPSATAILLTDVVTPYVARTARRSGYAGVAALSLAPRLLYRRIGSVLQKSQRTRRPAHIDAKRPTRRRSIKIARYRIGVHGDWPGPLGGSGKIKLSS